MNADKQSVVILHDIRSTHNVGSIFRTSDACGISKVYISGYTPAPIDKFNRKQKDIAKTALGAEDSIPWEKVEDVYELISKLKKDGFQIVAIEQSENSVDYKDVKISEKVAFVVGPEVVGIYPDLLKECDVVVEIPMKGEKESLNVSVAFGIAVFRMLGV
jgi:23S rRNA (guanosine2251-2'-O)-methyltransferase